MYISRERERSEMSGNNKNTLLTAHIRHLPTTTFYYLFNYFISEELHRKYMGHF
jgi:hypothetical protein